MPLGWNFIQQLERGWNEPGMNRWMSEPGLCTICSTFPNLSQGFLPQGDLSSKHD
jgi:hypothetical protein